MNKKDLDNLKELYSSVYDEEQLNEAPGGKARFWDSNLGRLVANTGRTAGDVRDVFYGDPSGSASRDARQRLSQRVTGKPVTEYPDQRAARISRAQDAAIASADKAEKEKAKTENPTKSPVPGAQPAGSPPSRPAGSPPSRPAAASGPVLSKRNGVEGTGVGANFKERAFTAAEKSRYSSVAAQNAAKSSTSTGTPKPSSPTPAASAPKPAIGTLGSTSFERRTPTSAELSAARGAAAGSTPEQRLQAAQKTNLPATGPTPAIPSASSVASDVAKANSPAVINRPAPTGTALAAQQAQQKKPPTPGTGIMQNQSYEWPSAKTIRDIAGAYSSIYEAKKKVDQDEGKTNRWWDDDGDGVGYEKGEVSGKFKKKKKVTKEELELWVNELLEEGYDLSEYTWDDMFEIYEEIKYIEERDEGKPGLMFKKIAASATKRYGSKEAGNRVAGAIRKKVLANEATRMRKELGQEGEIATRKELAARSNAYQRSGSVDNTIAAAERGANSPYVKNVRGESDADTAARERTQSQTLSSLAASRRSSVRDKPRAGLRGYGADVTGSDRELQNSRRSAMAAGTLTPREKKMLNREAYETYEFVASYLLENNFANTIEDANAIINNMSEGWFESIMEEKGSLPIAKMKRKETELLGSDEEHFATLNTPMGSPERKKAMKNLDRFDNINTARRSVATRGGKRPLPMPEVGRYRSKDED
jgi:hypothetical protein